MQLSSPAFSEGAAIPAHHTCDGDDVPPPLTWDGAPDGTAAFVLIVHDPDARDFVHWLLADVPGDRRELAEGEGDRVGTPGRNDFGRTGWGGPCPPSGQHRYVFTIYALSEPLGMSSTPDEDGVRSAMEGRVLAEGTVTGVYARGG